MHEQNHKQSSHQDVHKYCWPREERTCSIGSIAEADASAGRSSCPSQEEDVLASSHRSNLAAAAMMLGWWLSLHEAEAPT